jgi:hypothetical protein
MIDFGTALNDADFEALERSWIDRASAENTRLFRVMSIEGAELVGQKDPTITLASPSLISCLVKRTHASTDCAETRPR